MLGTFPIFDITFTANILGMWKKTCRGPPTLFSYLSQWTIPEKNQTGNRGEWGREVGDIPF